MAKGGRKSKEMKHVGFRMPLDVYQDYVMIAESRGVDLSAVFNWTLHEFRPTLLQGFQCNVTVYPVAICGKHDRLAAQALRPLGPC